MNVHQNAALTPSRREQLVRFILGGATVNVAAAAFRVAPRTAAKWRARFRSGGVAALQDRSSRPTQLRRPTPLSRQQEVITLRRQKLTGWHIAERTGLSRSTVSRILRRAHLSHWRDLVAAPPVVRYERAHPGELLHIDIKKLVRIVRPSHRVTGNRRDTVKGHGWEYVFVAIDDHSRLAHAALHPNERQASAVAFLKEAAAHYARFGVTLQRVMTDNGPCFHARAFGEACRQLGIKHIRTKPYTPRTNGKAERFIQSSIREWAYGCSFDTSAHRAAQLPRWLHRYNWHRPHSSLGRLPPVSRLRLNENNLLTLHS
jgi:transposase InsO family protein